MLMVNVLLDTSKQLSISNEPDISDISNQAYSHNQFIDYAQGKHKQWYNWQMHHATTKV